jgi:4a-hydroxytetrahydrobiopterin dehydratase
MSDRSLLASDEIHHRLTELPGWVAEEGRLRKAFAFRDFVEAFSFMSRCAFEAERRDHHPSLHNVYNKVSIELWTHDAGGLTALDFDLAAAIERRSQV